MSGPTSHPTGLMTDPFRSYATKVCKVVINHLLDMEVPPDDIIGAMDEELNRFEDIVLGPWDYER